MVKKLIRGRFPRVFSKAARSLSLKDIMEEYVFRYSSVAAFMVSGEMTVMFRSCRPATMIAEVSAVSIPNLKRSFAVVFSTEAEYLSI